MSTGVNVGWQFTAVPEASCSISSGSTCYVRDRTTSEDFTLPKSTITHGLGGAYEYRRGGYCSSPTALVRRARLAPWGPAVARRPAHLREIQRELSRDWYFRLFHKIHLNGAYFGGRGSIGFRQYQFGMFDDTRIHGVPASGVRIPGAGMARGSYTFNLLDLYRLDVFLEQAWGRDRDRRTGWQPITGSVRPST